MAFAIDTGETITRGIADLIRDICPQAVGLSMYGGTVFETEPGNHATMVCGYFIYKAHVSLEFSKGAFLDDPHQVLQGKGKFRRHIKLTTQGDLETFFVADYLRQAFTAAQ